MASLYKRKGSRFWWLKWSNPNKLGPHRVERFSTRFATGDPAAYRKAVELWSSYDAREDAAARGRRDHPFAEWVETYLAASHGGKTLCRYLALWKTVASYLAARDVTAPCQVTREICQAYVPWRLEHLPHLNGHQAVCRNTAILEVKFLAKLLTEAQLRGWIAANPAAKLKLQRDPSRVKDEISDEKFRIIRQELDRRLARAATAEERRNAEFLSVSFEIAWYQGLRLSETWIDLNAVNLDTRLMRIRAKGNTYFEPPINPALVPLFQRLKNEGRRYTYERPHLYSLKWFDFFDGLRKKHPGFENISFHSTRVSLESRMERAGAPEVVVMKLLNHSGSSGTSVHRIYRRVLNSEVDPYWPASPTV